MLKGSLVLLVVTIIGVGIHALAYEADYSFLDEVYNIGYSRGNDNGRIDVLRTKLGRCR